MTSARLFKGAVLLLAPPAVLLPLAVSVLVIARLAGWPGGIGSFTFVLTRSELATVAGIVLVAFIFLCVLGIGIAIRYRRRKSRLTR